MERNGRCLESDLHQYKNKLSPIGLKIFNVLINNYHKENNNNRTINRFDRRYGQKRKVITFEDSHVSRQSLLSQNEPDNYLNNRSRRFCSNIRDIIINDIINDINVRHVSVPTSAQFCPFNSPQNNVEDSLSISPAENFDPKLGNSKTDVFNAQNNAKDGNLNVVSNPKRLLYFDERNKCNDNFKEDDNINITPIELLKLRSAQKDTFQDNPGICSKDLLQTLDMNINRKMPLSETFKNNLNIFPSKTSTPIFEDLTHNTGKDVPWNEMFDTELLPDVIDPAVKEKMIEAQKEIATEKQIKMTFHINKNTNVNSNVAIKNKAKSIISEMVVNSKRAKSNKDKTKNKESVEKKIKQNKKKEKPKRVIRKEKYTKTVKKWLDVMDPNNLVEVVNNPESEIIEPEIVTKMKISDTLVEDTEVVIEPNISAKKIIQAQLTNKGGIMKFGKPAVEQEVNRDLSTATRIDKETVSKVANKVNVKKGKLKLIASLKSEVPVKEIEFTIEIVDENNWTEKVTTLQNNITELYAVITYSNGFCQLNKQFTEDDCTPDGVMLLNNDVFYYFKKTNDIFSNIIKKFLEKQTAICYDGKNILIYFKHYFELEVDFVIHDVKIGGSLLEPDNPAESFGDLQKLTSSTPEYTIATECRLQKTAWYMTLLRDCADRLKTKLLEQSLWSLFEDIEMKVLPIIADMEFRGIHVNIEKLKSMEGILLSRMKKVELECHRAAGKTFQITSPMQVAAILYDELQLHTLCNLTVKETIGKGAKSTSETMLRTLVPLHPLPELILEYRRLHKAHATFVAGIGQHVKDGVLKPTWVQTAAATGRVAANNPNVQAIPKTPFSLSSKDNNPEEALNLRSVYIARPGYVLLAADFKQVECRVFASAAADTVLLEALRSGGDLFTVLAAKWLSKPEQEVGPVDRERTKRIVYARLYGAGVRKLMDILDVSYDQALSVSASFDRTFPSLKSFGASVSRACAGGRAPRTPSGRARPLPALSSTDANERAHAQRQALNFLVQGTAADVCKVAMTSALGQLKAASIRAHLLIQIHDELVWEVASEQLNAAHAVIKAAMESSGLLAGLPTPLPVAVAAGGSWGELIQIDDAQLA